MKSSLPLAVLIVCVFLGYVWEFAPAGVEWVAPFDKSGVPLAAEWWFFLIAKEVIIVLLVWTVWYMIPKGDKIIKIAVGTVAVFLTTVPINFILFYFPPFKVWVFLLRAITSVLIGIFILYGVNNNNNRSRS